MSYTRTITSNGNSISQEGGQSFNQQLDDLQEQIEEGGGGSITDLGTSSGTANALAGASLVDTATTFTAGRLYRIRTNAANSGAATCSINGGTGVAMKKSPSSAALASGDIADATELLLYYDGTNLQVLSGMTVSADEFAQVSKSSDQSLSGGTDNIITFGVNNAISNGSIHSTSSNTGRLVAILGGTYRCTITLQFDSNGVSNNYDYGIRKNGTTKVAVWRETFATSPSIRAVTAEFILTLAANDYIEWFVYPSSGGTYFVSGNTAGSGYFTAATFERIGA